MTDIDAMKNAPETAPSEASGGALLGLRLPLTVELGAAQMTLREILEMKPAAIVSLGVSESAPVRLLVNGIHVAEGDLLSDGDRLTFRVKKVDDGTLTVTRLKAGAAPKEVVI